MEKLIWQFFCHYQSQDHVTDVKNSKNSPSRSSQGFADGITVGLVQCRFYGNLDIKEYFKHVTQNEFSLYETYLVISHNVFGFYSHICEN